MLNIRYMDRLIVSFGVLACSALLVSMVAGAVGNSAEPTPIEPAAKNSPSEPAAWAALAVLSGGPAAAAACSTQQTSSQRAAVKSGSTTNSQGSQATEVSQDEHACGLPMQGSAAQVIPSGSAPGVAAPPTESPAAIPLLALLLGPGTAGTGAAAILAARDKRTLRPNSPN